MMSSRSLYNLEGHELVLIDSITQIVRGDAGKIVVSGSHGGASAASFAGAVKARLYVFNDAGIGKNDSGVAGLEQLEVAGIAACKVSHESACIGSAMDSFENGVVSAVNNQALKFGVVVGVPLKSKLAQIVSA